MMIGRILLALALAFCFAVPASAQASQSAPFVTAPGSYNAIDATQQTGLSASTTSATFSGTTMTVNTASVGVFTVGMTVTFSGSAGQTITQLGTYAGSTGTLILSGSASGTAIAASGADTSMCAKISAAAATLYATSPLGGTIDARGFTGTQTCGGSMFANWPNGSYYPTVILLGSVVIQINVQQVIPAYTNVQGYAPYSFTGLGGTLIQATTGFPASTALVEMGASNPSFSTKLSKVSIDCVEAGTSTALTGGIGLENQNSQEGTAVDSVQTTGCLTGVYIHGAGSADSGPYTNLDMNDTDIAATPDTSFKCLQIGDSSSPSFMQSDFSRISCGGGAGAGTPAVLIGIDAYNVSVSAVHLEHSGIGIQVGGVHFARAIVLKNINCSTSLTTCVDLPSSPGSESETFFAIGDNDSAATNLLVDHQTNGCTQTVSSDNYLGFYSRSSQGPNFGNQIITNSTTCASFLGNIGSATAASGTAPTVSSCGTSPSVTGTNTRGTITAGTGSTTQCTLTFAAPAFSTTPFCEASPALTTSTVPTTTTGLIGQSSSSTASAVIFNYPSQASLQFNYWCVQ